MYTQSVAEIIEKAIEVEKEGVNFYRKLAEEVHTEAVRNIFLGLVADEVRHQADFIELAKTMKGVVIESSLDILEVMDTAVTTLRSAINGSQLVDMCEVNLAQAIKIGIHSEKESIRIYSSLLSVANTDFNDVIKKIITQEQMHLSALESMKSFKLG